MIHRRGACAVCGRLSAIKADGTIQPHGSVGGDETTYPTRCTGSLRPPADEWRLADELANYRQQHPRTEPAFACRQMPTRHCPAVYANVCGDRPCARFESNDVTPWLPEIAQQSL